MYDEFFLNNSNDIIKQKSDIDFDIMFNDLSKGVENVNEMISNLNKQKLDNNNEYDEINSEKRKLHKMQEEFETYMRIQRAELKKKTDQTEMDIRSAKKSLENIWNTYHDEYSFNSKNTISFFFFINYFILFYMENILK